MPALVRYWSKDPLLRVSYIPRGQPGQDPLFKIRPVIDQVITSSQIYSSPCAAVSIDEVTIPFQGRFHFKQYIQNKPHPWGVVWCCWDPSNSYLLDFCFYTGKKEGPMPHGLGHHVVMTLGSTSLDKNHHFYLITTSVLFTL